MARRAWFGLRWIAVGAGVGVVAVLLGVVIAMRLRTGSWSLPDGDDLVHIARGSRTGPPSRVIYLQREPLEIAYGDDDARRNRSGIVSGTRTSWKLPGFRGSASGWKAIVGCVRQQFAPFDLEVTDVRPERGDYILVAVGGKPRDIGLTRRNVGGLAPFSGEAIPNAVVFAFAQTLGNRSRVICETIAMEVGHAYGLDHEYLCKDVMTYLSGCGNKSFVDADAPCGEKKRRPCAPGGAVTQNSYRHLASTVGRRAMNDTVVQPSASDQMSRSHR